MIETWRPVADYEDIYEVSDRGRVRSLSRITKQGNRWNSTISYKTKARVLSLSNTNGYRVVGLTKNGRQLMYRVHRLVLAAFVGPQPTDKHQTAHWDGDRCNNVLENLRWATQQENSDDMGRHGRRGGPAQRTHCPQGHPYKGDNRRTYKYDYGQACVTCLRQRTREKKRQQRGAVIFRRRTLNKAVREAVAMAAKGRCAVCRELFNKFEVDHILGVELGGGDEMSNLRALCPDCHKKVTKEQSAARAKTKRIIAQRGLRDKKMSAKDKIMAKALQEGVRDGR